MKPEDLAADMRRLGLFDAIELLPVAKRVERALVKRYLEVDKGPIGSKLPSRSRLEVAQIRDEAQIAVHGLRLHLAHRSEPPEGKAAEWNRARNALRRVLSRIQQTADTADALLRGAAEFSPETRAALAKLEGEKGKGGAGAKQNPARGRALDRRRLKVFGRVARIFYVRPKRKGVVGSGKPHYHDFDNPPVAYYDPASRSCILFPVDAGPVPRT